ncbi:MAG: periplasmic heavy metal sensor [Spirochaetaceae bacterium]|nr:periplasmic heavy metal sensor [Spirochaetaceae bacterium]
MEKRKVPFLAAIILIAALLFVPGLTVSAQMNSWGQKLGPDQQQGPGQRGFSLTPEEKKAIAEILAKDESEIKKAKAEIRICEAKISRLMLEESPDMDAIAAEIDTIDGFRKTIRLDQLKRQIEIRKLLGEERWEALLQLLHGFQGGPGFGLQQGKSGMHPDMMGNWMDFGDEGGAMPEGLPSTAP